MTPDPVTAHLSWADLRAPDPALEERVRDRLARVESELSGAAGSEIPLVSEAARYLLSAGGKRFRPLLVMLAGNLGDPDDERLVPGAVAIELTHLATLHHDDVIDEAETRRGIPSANARWDNTVAILTGDFLFARASEISAALGGDVTRLLALTIATVCEGQILEVQAAGRVDADEEAYLDIIRRKTASLIATSCRLGGMLSGTGIDVIEGLDRFGRALGVAFQLSDDIMDLTSDRATLGKEPGADLREGVYTLPVIYALRESSRRDRLRALLEAGPPQDERLAGALEIVRSDGSLDQARAVVAREVERAVGEAQLLPEGLAREALVHLARFIAARCGADREVESA
ncbi:MAG TPA: polyprenyl synthetase family protein [Actinomycetota bacterium]|nr:polyprenyl synthetase family protein [Actinomycetota bacterium]